MGTSSVYVFFSTAVFHDRNGLIRCCQLIDTRWSSAFERVQKSQSEKSSRANCLFKQDAEEYLEETNTAIVSLSAVTFGFASASQRQAKNNMQY